MQEKYLLDTHYVLWALREPKKIPPSVEKLLNEANPHMIYISDISFIEIGIKVAIGKLTFEVEGFGVHEMRYALRQFGYPFMPITFPHIAAMARLPMLHRDPFDRLLIGQAVAENLTLITMDKALQQYAVKQFLHS